VNSTQEQWPAIDCDDAEMILAKVRVANRTPCAISWTTASGARVEMRITPGRRTSPHQLIEMQSVADMTEAHLAQRLNRL
jgi:hypothetical protein